MTGETIREIMSIIRWATEAAREHVQLCVHRAENPLDDCEGNMGLWQAFQAKWPKERFPGSYDLAVCVYGTTFTETVKAIVAALPRA